MPTTPTRVMGTRISREHRPRGVQLLQRTPRNGTFTLSLRIPFSLDTQPHFPYVCIQNEKNAHSSHLVKSGRYLFLVFSSFGLCFFSLSHLCTLSTGDISPSFLMVLSLRPVSVCQRVICPLFSRLVCPRPLVHIPPKHQAVVFLTLVGR